jgi:hypothetical protein
MLLFVLNFFFESLFSEFIYTAERNLCIKRLPQKIFDQGEQFTFWG